MSTVPLEEATSVKHRRRWTREQKRRIVEEAAREGASIAEVAKEHGISSSLLYRWRSLMEGQEEVRKSEVEGLRCRLDMLEWQVQRQAGQIQQLLSSLVTAQLG